MDRRIYRMLESLWELASLPEMAVSDSEKARIRALADSLDLGCRGEAGERTPKAVPLRLKYVKMDKRRNARSVSGRSKG